MTEGVAVAWVHYMSIMLLMAALLGEHLVLKAQVSVAEAKTLQRLDRIYGISAGVLLVTGVWRMYLEKGVDYYLHNGAFHILVALFVVIGLLSIYPTIVFLRWGRDTKAGKTPVLTYRRFKGLQMTLRLEMLLLLVAPLFAAWMAHALF